MLMGRDRWLPCALSWSRSPAKYCGVDHTNAERLLYFFLKYFLPLKIRGKRKYFCVRLGSYILFSLGEFTLLCTPLGREAKDKTFVVFPLASAVAISLECKVSSGSV